MAKQRKKPERTVFNNNDKGDGLSAAGLRTMLHRALKGEQVRNKARELHEQAKQRSKNLTPEEQWFFEHWEPREGERNFFVTDYFINVVRNLNTPYILELGEKSSYPELWAHVALRRNIPVYFVKPYDLEGLKSLALELDKTFS